MSEAERHTLVHQAAYGGSVEEKLLALTLLMRAWEVERAELAALRGRLATMTDQPFKLCSTPNPESM